MNIESDVYGILTTILKHQGLPAVDINPTSELYDDGLGLDSLCVAELSSMLEKKFGSDPYTSKSLPLIVQDIIDFYATDESD